MRFHILIPARLASTRLPDKALADIGGLPMVVRVAQTCSLAGAESTTVATDHERILQACAAQPRHPVRGAWQARRMRARRGRSGDRRHDAAGYRVRRW